MKLVLLEIDSLFLQTDPDSLKCSILAIF